MAKHVASKKQVTEVGQVRLHTETFGSGKPRIIVLHDGLGSISQWRDVPARIAERTAMTVLVYERPGHGSSTPIPGGPWPATWMQDQAALLADLLEAVGARAPILVGHSDGGTIALLHAAAHPERVGGVVALAAHSYVEDRCVDAIAALRADPQAIVAALGRHHDDSAAIFNAWSGGWTSKQFRTWDARPRLGAVRVPVLIAQGSDDEYATPAMVTNTAAAIESGQSSVADTSLVEGRLLPDIGHMLHRTDPGLVIDLVANFVAEVEAPTAGPS